MEFEWDETKRRTNLEKHGFDFRDIDGFDWSSAIIEPDLRRDYGEERFIARGLGVDGEGYHVVFTLRVTGMRLISVRRFQRKDWRTWNGM